MTACQQRLEDREPTVQARRRKYIVTFTGKQMRILQIEKRETMVYSRLSFNGHLSKTDT